MLKIGRYKIAFGRTFWVQTRGPTTTVRRFLCFWVFKEARPGDVDKKQKFPLPTRMVYEGRVYRYWKASKTYKKGDVVVETEGNGSV